MLPEVAETQPYEASPEPPGGAGAAPPPAAPPAPEAVPAQAAAGAPAVQPTLESAFQASSQPRQPQPQGVVNLDDDGEPAVPPVGTEGDAADVGEAAADGYQSALETELEQKEVGGVGGAGFRSRTPANPHY